MSDKETAQEVIESYRKRQQQAQRAPTIIAIAAVLLIIGVAVIIFWLLGSNQPAISSIRHGDPNTNCDIYSHQHRYRYSHAH